MRLRTKVARSAGMALIALAGTMVGVGQGDDAVAVPNPAAAPLMTRVMADAHGVHGAVVTAEILPRRGAGSQPYFVPRDVIHVDGRAVEVRLSPDDVPAKFIDSEGIATVGVHVMNAHERLAGSWFQSVRLISDAGGSYWQDPAAAVPSRKHRSTHLTTAGRRTAAQNALPTGRIHFARTHANLPVLPVSKRSVGMVAYSDPSDDPSHPRLHCRTIRTRTRPATVGTSYPLKGTKSWLTYSASTSSSFGIAVSFNKGASFHGSGTRTEGDEWGQDFARSGKFRSYRVSVLYNRVDCRQSYPGKWKQGIEMSRRWIPAYQTGGTSTYRLRSAPSHFRKCDTVARGKWWRGRTRGNDYSFGAGVKFKDIIGIDLFSRRSYSNGARLYYANSKRRMRLCGNDDYISRASKLRERRLR